MLLQSAIGYARSQSRGALTPRLLRACGDIPDRVIASSAPNTLFVNATAVNLLSALTISCIISIMAVLKNPQAKAVVYSLPIPGAAALLATGGKVLSSTFIGLILADLFIWCVFYLHQVRKWPILTSDLLFAIAYVAAGCVLSRALTASLSETSRVALLLWVGCAQRCYQRCGVQKG